MNCCRHSRGRGLTLIEVVAAIAILGTLLVGVVLAKSRHTRQLQHAHWQLEAVEAADDLIAGWWTREAGVPIADQGTVSGNAALRWRTRLVKNPAIEGLGARVVRVELYAADMDRQGLAQDEQNARRLVVDLVVPDPEIEARERQEAAEREQGQGGERGQGDA